VKAVREGCLRPAGWEPPGRASRVSWLFRFPPTSTTLPHV